MNHKKIDEELEGGCEPIEIIYNDNDYFKILAEAQNLDIYRCDICSWWHNIGDMWDTETCMDCKNDDTS